MPRAGKPFHMKLLPHSSRAVAVLLALFIATSARLAAADAPLKSESFDRDPGWEGHNNHVVPEKPQPVKQDFGYSATQFAGKAAGELGGVVQRATTPASY